MAKCIQVVGQGVPVRMSNEDAFQVVVRDKGGSYCPKHVWRKWMDGTRPIARLVGNKISETRTLARHDQHAR